MKTMLSIALIAVMILSMIAVPMAMAEEVVTTTLTDSAVTSTDTTATDAEINQELDASLNEDVSGTKIAWRQMQLLFTFNQEKKADRELDLARLRLIQAKVAAQNGNDEAMAKAIEAHNQILERVQARIATMDGASDEQGVKNSATKLVSLERAIQVHEARVERLNTVLANENLTSEQKAKVEAHIANAEQVTVKLTEAQTAKMEQVKTRLMAVAGMSEEEANAAVEKLDIKAGELADKIQERARERITERIADNSGNTEEVQTETQSEGESSQASSGAQSQAGKA